MASGSCRDIAALFIETTRHLGFGARAVSGYLFDPDMALDDAGSTHAWTEVYLPGAGWIPFDPTHLRIGGAFLIPVAVARSITQIMPVVGGYVGTSADFLSMVSRFGSRTAPSRSAAQRGRPDMFNSVSGPGALRRVEPPFHRAGQSAPSFAGLERNSGTLRDAGSWCTANQCQELTAMPKTKDNRLSDKEALHLAETTEVSPQQAKDLAKKHGKIEGKKQAEEFKAGS